MKTAIQTTTELVPYQKFYSDKKFWYKISKFAKHLGAEAIYYILILYYTLLSPNVSIKNKAIICGALGYLILPIDLLPDIIPVLGFTDDLAAIKLAYDAIKVSITQEIETQAKTKVDQWFNEE